MHVSLPRLFHHVSPTKPFLLWLGFGVLAVVPWQYLCGQEYPVTPIIEQQIDDPLAEWDRTNGAVEITTPPPRDPVSQAITAKGNTDSKQLTSPSLIFRGQNAPLEMRPIQVDPRQSRPEMDDPGILQSDLISGRSGQAYGSLFRIGGFTGPAIGRNTAIFPLEWMPYSLIDNNLFFADLRGYKGSTDTWGANLGGGYRRYLPRFDRILGVNAFFDYDTTSGATFRQVGFGVESLGALYDVRANAYLPTGSSSQQLSLVNIDGTQQFVGHNLIVNQQKSIANALHGFDAEIGVPVPGTIPQRHDLRVFGGGYWYEGVDISAFGGWKTRIQANVIPSIALQLEVTHDQQFNTNVVFGGSWSYGGFKQSPDQPQTQYGRMTTPIIRNYNMIVGNTNKYNVGVEVINPATNQPYFIEHVDSQATTSGDGTVEHPFQVFADAQNSTPHDIIFVRANSVFDGVGVALEPNVRVLGEASTVQHLVATTDPNSNSGLGNSLLLPQPSGNTPNSRPMFLRAPGDGVILANNSEFSGFLVGDIRDSTSGPAGRGIVGDGIQNAVVRQTDVSFSGDQAVYLQNTSGTISFLGDVINDPLFDATTFQVVGTTGQVIFSSDPLTATAGVINNVQGAGGRSLIVEQTQAGSSVNFTGSTVNDTNGNGILLRNNAGIVTLGNALVKNGLGIGLDIKDNTGLIGTNGLLQIDGSASDAIVISGLATGGQVSFNDPTNPVGVSILNRAERGIYLNNNLGNVIFGTGVNVQAAGSVAKAAIEYQDSSGNVTFSNNVAISGGGPGFLIGHIEDNNPNFNTGQFSVNGNTTITNPTGIGIQVTHDQSRVLFNAGLNSTTTINERGNIGIQILDDRGLVSFNGATTIANTAATPTNRPAVDIRQNTAQTNSVFFNVLNVQGATGPAATGFGGVGVNIGGANLADANTAPVTFSVLNVAATNGTALFVNREGQNSVAPASGLAIGQGTISSVGGTAVDIRNSAINVNLTSVSSTASATLNPDYGIQLLNNNLISQSVTPALDNFMFTVGTTTSNSQTTGGTISGASIAAVNLNQTQTNLIQTGAVSLNNMTIQANTMGIVANNLLQLNVSNSNFSNNIGTGLAVDQGTAIDAKNLLRVDISRSLFNLNGTTLSDHAIYLQATTPLAQPVMVNSTPTNGRYLWNISNNTNQGGLIGGFTGRAGTGDLVLISGSAPGGGDLQVTNNNTNPAQIYAVPLVFQFQNNSMLVQQQAAGLAVNWTGQIDAASSVINLVSAISSNTINLTGQNDGISIKNATTQYTTNFAMNNNAITGTGGGNNGLYIENFGPSNLQIGTFTGNIFDFTTPPQNLNGTSIDYGMNISMFNTTNTSSFVNISNNTITMRGGPQNQGILFPSVQAPATFTFNNNLITITNAQPLVGQGIDFALVSKPSVVLRGNVSNTILINGNGPGITSQNWFNRQPANSTTGQLIINGFSGP
jgi:hypothetical protein